MTAPTSSPPSAAWARVSLSRKRCGLKDSAALNLKRRIVGDLIEFFGEDAIRRLLDGVRPGWESDLRTVRDRHLGKVIQTTDPMRLAAR